MSVAPDLAGENVSGKEPVAAILAGESGIGIIRSIHVTQGDVLAQSAAGRAKGLAGFNCLAMEVDVLAGLHSGDQGDETGIFLASYAAIGLAWCCWRLVRLDWIQGAAGYRQ